MTTILFTALGLAILAALLWLLFAPRWSKPQPAIETLELEQLRLLHCRHFPQISQLLQSEDREFIERIAPPAMARAWKRERRKILREFLNGLNEDFARLENLARLIAALSTEVSRSREWEWFWLGLKFHVLFRLVAIRMVLGWLPTPPLARLTDFVASRAAELEISISQMAGVLPPRLRPTAST